jgi:N-acetylmuramoyl-L-alanine amidase
MVGARMTDARSIDWLPGHGTKRKGYDPGALSPCAWTEADLVRKVCAVAWLTCESARVPSNIQAGGDYDERGKRAALGGSALVVQIHADAVAAETGPDISRVFFYPNSPRAAADLIAAELRTVVPWPVQVFEADGATWGGAHACLGSVAPLSVLVEVGFTDGARGRTQLPLIVDKLGAAIARGALKWRAGHGGE